MKYFKEYSKKKIVLLILLLLLTIIIRLPITSFPGTPDSYFLQGKSLSIIEKGYANWILHPSSLFGSYPISYPSAYMYFLSYFSLISGLTIGQTVQFIAIILGIMGTFGIFIFAKETGSFSFAYLSALIFSLSVYFINLTTAGNASARIFLLSLLPIFMWILLKAYHSKKSRFLYISIAILLYIFLAMSHRMVQLISIVLIAYFLTIFYFLISKLWPRFNKTIIYKNYFEKRYTISKKNLFFDIFLMIFIIGIAKIIKNPIIILTIYIFIIFCIIFPEYKKYSRTKITEISGIKIILDIITLSSMFIISKIIDLSLRDRLNINIEKIRSSEYWNYIFEGIKYIESSNIWFKIIALLISILFMFLIIKSLVNFIRRQNMKSEYKKIDSITKTILEKFIDFIRKKPQLTISIVLTTLFLILFISQFFGYSLYSLRVEDYYETALVKGNSPLAIFLNMTINYTTGTTILFPLSALGIFILVFKKDKKFLDVFLILIMLALSSILLDKRYVRLFVIPFFSLFIGVALCKITEWGNKLRLKKIVSTSFIILFIILISFSFILANRERIIEKEDGQKEESLSQQRYNAAIFLKSLESDKAIIGDTNLGIIYGLSEKKLVPISNINQSDLNARDMTLKEIFDNILAGKPIKSFWIAEDWINGGDYYNDKHSWQIINSHYNSYLNRKLLQYYSVQYYTRNKEIIKKEKLFSSIEPIKNKVYDNPSVSIWDISKDKGRT